MVKYVPEDTSVVFEEIPDEITLAINISNCPHHCPGCHSPYLREDIGIELTCEELDKLIEKNDGITCVALMGEGNDLDGIFKLGEYIHDEYGLKVALYAGTAIANVPKRFWWEFDYIKVGGYKEELGPLNSETTNQRMYKNMGLQLKDGIPSKKWEDITERFWKRG